MKKLTIALLLSAFAATASAAYTGPQDINIITVSAMENTQDEAVVSLQGYITESLGNEMYTFKDQSGTISVEIDQDVLNNIDINENDLVIITGEADKNWGDVTIDVDTIQKSAAK
ncbi:YgiW/YdeI family stress tolerance OB fold protein [Vibrio sinensis]|nr:NirD/YgiW/YdeI family stress tolerance protein [Vibrio sinensis]